LIESPQLKETIIGFVWAFVKALMANLAAAREAVAALIIRFAATRSRSS